MGRIISFWIENISSDAVLEVAVIISVAYVTCFVGEYILVCTNVNASPFVKVYAFFDTS